MNMGVATPTAISARKLPTTLASPPCPGLSPCQASGPSTSPAAPLTHPLPTWQLREHIQASPFPAFPPHCFR